MVLKKRICVIYHRNSKCAYIIFCALLLYIVGIYYVPYGLANLGNIKSLSWNASKIFDSHIWSDQVIFEIWYHSQRVSSKAPKWAKHPKFQEKIFWEPWKNFLEVPGWCWMYSTCRPWLDLEADTNYLNLGNRILFWKKYRSYFYLLYISIFY